MKSKSTEDLAHFMIESLCGAPVSASLGVLLYDFLIRAGQNIEPSRFDAPKWAKYCVMDEHGDWYWLKKKPIKERIGWYFTGKFEKVEKLTWENSLREINHD